MSSRYREIDVAGSCQEMGRQIGEAARDEILGFTDFSWERISQSLRLSRARVLDVVRASLSYTEGYSPDLLLELKGMSESSGVPFEDLMFLQLRNQLTADMDSGCTSFSVGRTRSADSRAMTGQNWDNDPGLDSYTVVLTRRPTERPAFISVTQAGLIAYIGFSEAGIAACLNSLPAPSRSAGVPHYFTLRRIFECERLEDAQSMVTKAHRAIPANIMLGTAEGPANLEVTLEEVFCLQPDHGQVLFHTNHGLHPRLAAVNEQFPELIQSHPRLNRIHELTKDAALLTADDLRAAMQDHSGFPQSICRHANTLSSHGDWETVFSVIMFPGLREMQIARGKPCVEPYETYQLK